MICYRVHLILLGGIEIKKATTPNIAPTLKAYFVSSENKQKHNRNFTNTKP